MLRITLGVFIVLHGLVHLLYFGQSARTFELQPGMVWPHGTWAFSRLLGNGNSRTLACISLALAAVGFIVSGLGIFLQQTWWRPVVVGSAVFSSAIFILFWDGSTQHLDNKGAIGILINAAILVSMLLLRWFGF